MKLLYIYLITINALAFGLMLADKIKSKKRFWRIPERVLLGVCAVGGSMGGFLGMKLFRHKTQHPQFSIGIPVMLAIQIVCGVILYTLI